MWVARTRALRCTCQNSCGSSCSISSFERGADQVFTLGREHAHVCLSAAPRTMYNLRHRHHVDPCRGLAWITLSRVAAAAGAVAGAGAHAGCAQQRATGPWWLGRAVRNSQGNAADGAAGVMAGGAGSRNRLDGCASRPLFFHGARQPVGPGLGLSSVESTAWAPFKTPARRTGRRPWRTPAPEGLVIRHASASSAAARAALAGHADVEEQHVRPQRAAPAARPRTATSPYHGGLTCSSGHAGPGPAAGRRPAGFIFGNQGAWGGSGRGGWFVADFRGCKVTLARWYRLAGCSYQFKSWPGRHRAA